MKRLLILLLFTAIFGQSYSVAPFGSCSKDIYAGTLKQNAEDLIRRLNTESVRTFAVDSYINEEINKIKFISWVNSLACYYELAQNTKKNNQYMLYILTRYYTIATAIYSAANAIYKKNTLKLEEKNNLKKTLETIDTELKSYSLETYEILRQTELPSAWKKTVPKKLEEAFPNYGTFFKSYSLGKESVNKSFSNVEFEAFLKINGISITKHGLEDLLNQLEKFIYRLKETWFKNEVQLALIKEAEEIEKRIITQYSNFSFITGSFRQQISKSSDKINLIIFFIADIYRGIIQKLLKNINSL